MTFKSIANALDKHNKRMARDITGWKLVEGICIAAVVGLGTGVCIAHRSVKKARKDADNKTLNSTITIEVQAIEKLKIGPYVKKPV